MLDLDRVDLSLLGGALEDHSADADWWFDPAAGDSIRKSEEMSWEEHDVADPESLIWIEPTHSSEGYADMEEFIARLSDRRARDLLERAIAGRGAFRRFKDTLHEFAELREAWFGFRDARSERRAIAWLRGQELIDAAAAEAAIEARPDPESELLSGGFDAHAIARDVAADLRDLYGDRLRDVILFGSWARGDAHPESDIDLLVVLDEVESSWEERKRMEDALWMRSLEHETVICTVPISEDDMRARRTPLLINIRREGQTVG